MEITRATSNIGEFQPLATVKQSGVQTDADNNWQLLLLASHEGTKNERKEKEQEGLGFRV